MAYESPLTIADVIADISMNKYVLPAIQREFVWETSQIERLFDSVMQGYPFGAFCFGNFLVKRTMNMYFIHSSRIIMKRKRDIIQKSIWLQIKMLLLCWTDSSD